MKLEMDKIHSAKEAKRQLEAIRKSIAKDLRKYHRQYLYKRAVEWVETKKD